MTLLQNVGFSLQSLNLNGQTNVGDVPKMGMGFNEIVVHTLFFLNFTLLVVDYLQKMT